jgi:hypothetical protein
MSVSDVTARLLTQTLFPKLKSGKDKSTNSRMRLKCDGARAENRFRLSVKRTNPFKSAGASIQSTSGSRVVRNSGNNARYTMFRGGVKSTGYPLQSPVSPSLPLPCVTVCHHISTGLYHRGVAKVGGGGASGAAAPEKAESKGRQYEYFK